MTTDDLDRLRTIVRYDIATSCHALGLRCAGRTAAIATTPAEWRDVAADLRNLVTDAGRDHERRAAMTAATHLAFGAVIDAARAMCDLRDETMSIANYAAEVVADAGEAGVSL